MADTDTKIDEASTAATDAKSRFGKAIEEAKAGAEALKTDALDRTAAVKDKFAGAAGEWSDQAKEKSIELANQGKSKASDALGALGKVISGSAVTIDEKLGVQYGDYARGAARSIQETAASLESKELAEIGEDLKEFVRKSPATAVGIAAVTGYLFARLFRGSKSTDA
jgi:ElaB/YqjD/DUF883 family membrane-anchored ribosome-binding protein